MNASADIGTKAGSQKEYSIFLTDMGISYSVNGSFLISGTPGFDDRWLICLSISLKDTEQILARILPLVNDYGIPFLLIKDQLQHNRINNHAFPVQLFGKPLMLFPEDAQQSVRLAEALAAITNAFDGVVVPGCIRLGSIVYAVYARLNPGYKEDDTDQLPFILDIPAAEQVPFPDQMKWKERKIKRFIKKRYLPISLIRSSHKGNILKALDLLRMKWCFVKQAKAWAAEDYSGRTMRDRLLWQMEVSQKTYKAVRTPRMLGFAEQDGYSYLVSEYIPGRTLHQVVLETMADHSGLLKLLLYYHEVLSIVHSLHEAGYVHRDLTAKNFLVRDGEVFLTDFELAYPLTGTAMLPYSGGSPGYTSLQQRRNERPAASDDIFSLGALLYFLASRQHPKELSKLTDPERETKVNELDAPPELKDLINGCLKTDPDGRMDMPGLLQGIERYIGGHSNTILGANRLFQRRRVLWKVALSGLLMLLACVTVVTLWLVSDEPNSHPNGFTRKFLSNDLVPLTEITLPKNTRYIAGVVGDSVFFSTLTPGEVTTLHIPSRKMGSRFIVRDTALLRRLSKSGILQADRFGLALFDGNARLLILERPGHLPQSHEVPEIFSRAVRFSPYSVALRKFKPGVRDQYFYRYDLTKDSVQNESQVTEPRQDGGLVTGGSLDFNGSAGLGVYVTRYANHITLLDTNMRIQRIGHTIDTFQHYTLQSRVVLGGKGAKITNAGPAYYINNGVAMDQAYIYVNSNMKADNESAYQFMDSNVIDVYRATDLSYSGSFRLPVEEKKHLRNFKVLANKLYVLYTGTLRIYQIPGKIQSLKTAGL